MRNVGFYLYPRKRKTQKTVYYARFRLSNGKWTTGKNTQCTNREAAEIWAQEQIDTGKLEQSAGPNPTLDGWAAGFFGVGGRYDTAKKAWGREMSTAYVENLGRSYRKHVAPVFGHRYITDVKTMDLKTFFLGLYNDHEPKLSGSTVNGVLRSARSLFGEAERLGVIRDNPAKRVQRFAEHKRERGVLTQPELNRLFALDALQNVWNGYHVPYFIAMIAAGCGLRHGEIVALRPCDISDGVIRVHRAWDRAGGLFKPPKWRSCCECQAEFHAAW